MHFIDALLAVEIFHHRIGAPVADSPRLLPGRREPSTVSRCQAVVLGSHSFCTGRYLKNSQ